MSRTIPPADAILFKSPARVLHRIARPAAARRACRMLARRELWLRARRADSARGLAAVDDFVAQLRETEARRLAEIHGYDTAALAREFHGCFSRRPLPRHAPSSCAARPRSRARARMMGLRLRGEDVAISPLPNPPPAKGVYARLRRTMRGREHTARVARAYAENVSSSSRPAAARPA